MEKLKEIIKNPSGLDSMSNYMGDIPEDSWLCLMTRNRDSECLSESNWRCALKLLGDGSETVEIFRFGHWACGWWEALCVKEGSKEETIAQKVYAALQDYPVLDDEDFSNLEQKEADRVWSDCYDAKERIEYIRDNRSQFEFRSLEDMISCVRGLYFAGYASEIIS